MKAIKRDKNNNSHPSIVFKGRVHIHNLKEHIFLKVKKDVH